MEHPQQYHHYYRRSGDDDDENRPDHFPSPFSDLPPPPPPPPPFADEPPPPPHYYQEPPPPLQTEVTHVSHDHKHHSFSPHLPSVFHHHDAVSDTHTGPALDLSSKPSFKVYCKAEPEFLLTIREGAVVLARSDPSDHCQNWYKDAKYSTRVKDEEGYPCFALVNKATGQAMKHSIGATHPSISFSFHLQVLWVRKHGSVCALHYKRSGTKLLEDFLVWLVNDSKVQLIPYNPDILDESILWTESKDLGDGYRTVRMVNNIRLNLDAFHGDKKSGGVHEGTTIVLWEWNKGDNQRWKIFPLH